LHLALSGDGRVFYPIDGGEPTLRGTVGSSLVETERPADDRDWSNVVQDHRIWHCATADFQMFSAADQFFDPGYSVIDGGLVLLYDHFLEARYGASFSRDGLTWTPIDVDLPAGPASCRRRARTRSGGACRRRK